MNPKFNLPVHKPDPDLWNRIDAEMDYQEMVESYDMDVREMPAHSAAERVWQAIEARLPFIPYYRRSYFRVGMAMLAIVLVSFLGWIISQLIIDITPEKATPSENTIIQPQGQQEKTAATFNAEGTLPSGSSGQEQEQSALQPAEPSHHITANTTKDISTTEARASSLVTVEVGEESTSKVSLAATSSDSREVSEWYPLARENPSPPGTGLDMLTMASYRYQKTSSPALMQAEDDYYLPRRSKGHYTLGAYTMPEYMMFEEDAPDHSALSTSYGLSVKYNWKTMFFETGVGYRQFTANSLYGINFSDFQLLGSVLVVNEFQIVQYYNDEGELVVEKIYKPHFVQVYDTSSVVVEEQTDQRYSFIDVPLYFGKVVVMKNRYQMAVKAGARINIPLKNTVNEPVPPSQDADLVTVEPIAVLASKFFVQFNVALENRIYFTDRGYFSFDPMLGYHRQTIEYYNDVKRQSSWSAGLRVGIHYQIK